MTARSGWLRLRGSTVTLDDTQVAPVFVGRRQEHSDCEAVTQIDFNPKRDNEEAGLTLRLNERHHYELGIRGNGAGREIYLRYSSGSIHSEALRQTIGAGLVKLRARIYKEYYRFSYALGEGPFEELGGVEALETSGVLIGPFATGRGRESSVPADFAWFDYGPASDPPLNAATIAEAATLPPGYTPFTVETAERGIVKNYPFIRRLSSTVPPDVTARRGLVYARYGEREMLLDLFRPKKKGPPRPAVILVHGGAWISGHYTMENPFAIALAQRGYVALTVQYRLSNEAKYPAQIHDLKAAVRWLRANAAQLGVDKKRVAAAGASAGGHLVALLGATNGLKNFEGEGGNPNANSTVQAVVDIDGTATFIDPGNIAKEIKGPYDTNTRLTGYTYAQNPDIWREASPITHVQAQSAPTLFLNSSSYRPFQQREEMSEKLQKLGIASEIVVIPDTPHPFWLFQPWFTPTLNHLEQFLQKTMPEGETPKG